MEKVIITRPQEFATELAAELKSKDIDSLAFPTIDIHPLHMDVTITFVDVYLFVSRNAVINGSNLLLPDSKTLAMGKGTYDALVEAGFTPLIKPQKPYNTEQLLAHPDLSLKPTDHVAIVKGVGGRDLLAKELRKKVASVQTVSVYERLISEPDKKQLKAYLKTLDSGCRAIFVNSVETLENLLALTPETHTDTLLKQTVITGSERVAKAVAEASFEQSAILAKSTTDKDMVNCLLSQ